MSETLSETDDSRDNAGCTSYLTTRGDPHCPQGSSKSSQYAFQNFPRSTGRHSPDDILAHAHKSTPSTSWSEDEHQADGALEPQAVQAFWNDVLVEWSHLTDRLDKDSAVPVGQNGHDAPSRSFFFSKKSGRMPARRPLPPNSAQRPWHCQIPGSRNPQPQHVRPSPDDERGRNVCDRDPQTASSSSYANISPDFGMIYAVLGSLFDSEFDGIDYVSLLWHMNAMDRETILRVMETCTHNLQWPTRMLFLNEVRWIASDDWPIKPPGTHYS